MEKIRLFVSLFPVCPLGKAHYRSLELVKIDYLRINKGNFDAQCFLNDECISDIRWWVSILPTTAAQIVWSPPDHVIFCDASDYAWGAVFNTGQTCCKLVAQGHFTWWEKSHIIAVKELLAIFYGFHSFLLMFTRSHVLSRTDNTVALSYVKKFETSYHGLVCSETLELSTSQ